MYSTAPYTVGQNNEVATAFKITPRGSLTPVYHFTDQVFSGLTLGTDGNFSGTTYNGGTSAAGSVFKLTPSGGLTTLYSFTGMDDGVNPYAPPIEGTDGNFYGTAEKGG